MDSPHSSVISISSMPSDISDANHQTDPLVIDLNGEHLFDSGDGDMELVFNGARFETHKYLIKRFKKWSHTNPELRPGSVMAVTGNASSEDFGRMLRVLYATTLEGPFEFDTPTLVSALHIATDYEYPALRDYAIRHLERAELTAIKRIEIARRFGVPSWEKPAYLDLCNRDEPITEEEASILGMSAFVHVAKIREKEQRRRGGRGAEVEREQEVSWSKPPKASKATPKELPRPGSATEGRTTSPEAASSGLDRTHGRIETLETETRPSFIGTEMTKTFAYRLFAYGETRTQLGLPAPGCSCSSGQKSCQCMLPACAISAFKHIQTEQLAHKKSIMDLQSSVGELYALSESKPGPTGEQKVDILEQATSSMHEEIQVMLSKLSRKGARN